MRISNKLYVFLLPDPGEYLEGSLLTASLGTLGGGYII